MNSALDWISIPVLTDDCAVCGAKVEEERFQRAWKDTPNGKEVQTIGPFCSTCIPKLRVCFCCNLPFPTGEDIKYISKSGWFCTDCDNNMNSKEV